jgi:hypothetical protein
VTPAWDLIGAHQRTTVLSIFRDVIAILQWCLRTGSRIVPITSTLTMPINV